MLRGITRRLDGHLTFVLDPFSGTGTTLAACRQLGISSVGVELSRLGVEITRLRLDPPANLHAAVNLVRELSLKPLTPATPLIDELQWWMGDHNASALACHLDSLATVADARLRRFATITLSQALRPSSRWLAGSVKVTADPARVPPPLGAQWRHWADVVAHDCATETIAASAPRASTHVYEGDACRLPLAAGVADAVLTSPPYFVTYDYFEVNRLSYLAFGWPMPRDLQVGQRFGHERDGVGFTPPRAFRDWYLDDFGAEDRYFGRALRAYCQRLSTHLVDVMRVLRPGGVIAYALANSRRRGRTFDLVDAARELLRETGFVDIQTVSRRLGDKHILPIFRDPGNGRFASVGIDGVTERIIYARKPITTE